MRADSFRIGLRELKCALIDADALSQVILEEEGWSRESGSAHSHGMYQLASRAIIATSCSGIVSGPVAWLLFARARKYVVAFHRSLDYLLGFRAADRRSLWCDKSGTRAAARM